MSRTDEFWNREPLSDDEWARQKRERAHSILERAGYGKAPPPAPRPAQEARTRDFLVEHDRRWGMDRWTTERAARLGYPGRKFEDDPPERIDGPSS